MRLADDVRAQFRLQGRIGGMARAQRLSASRRAAISRHAALRRWTRVRFGHPRFSEAGLPGGAAIDRGIDDLAAGRVSQDSLLVSLAAPRLAREAVPLPVLRFRDAEWRLFRLLESAHGELAHARYLALLREAASFADACHLARVGRSRHAR